MKEVTAFCILQIAPNQIDGLLPHDLTSVDNRACFGYHCQKTIPNCFSRYSNIFVTAEKDNQWVQLTLPPHFYDMLNQRNQSGISTQIHHQVTIFISRLCYSDKFFINLGRCLRKRPIFCLGWLALFHVDGDFILHFFLAIAYICKLEKWLREWQMAHFP